MKIKFDSNGNRVLSLNKADLGARGFSVPTMPGLPRTHKDGIGPWTEGELTQWLREHGTERQKDLFGIY